jgi:hypothetical protein
MKNHTKYLTVLAVASTLAACGGGGGDPVVGGPVAPAAWQAAQLLETSDEQASNVDVDINAANVGYAVWLQNNGGERDVFASRYSDGVWKKAEPVTGVNVDAEDPQVAVLPNGEAIAIWRQTIPFFGSTVFFSKTELGVWQGAQILQSGQGVGNAESLELKAGATGNAMAVWARAGATPNDDSRIFASDFRSGAQPVTQQVDLGAGSADLPVVAIDAAGNVVVAWRQLDELNNNNVHRVHVAHNVDGTWEGVDLVSDPQDAVSAEATGPQVSAGPNGVASVVWRRTDGSIQLNTATAFTQQPWKGAEFVTSAGNKFRQEVAVDGLGNTTVVFFSIDNQIGETRFNSFRKQAGVAQGSSFRIERTVDRIRLGADASGRAIAVWAQSTNPAPLSMVASRLDPSTGQWSVPELIEQDDRGNTENVALAVNVGGRAVAAWLQKDGKVDANQFEVNNITANIFK